MAVRQESIEVERAKISILKYSLKTARCIAVISGPAFVKKNTASILSEKGSALLFRVNGFE